MSKAKEVCKCGHEAGSHKAAGTACTGTLLSEKPIISNKVLPCLCEKFEPAEVSP